MPRVANNRDTSDEEEGITALDGRLTVEELAAKLQEREANVQSGAGDGDTNQWRVYRAVTSKIERGEYVRMLVQASAWTGKSYLLTSIPLVHPSEDESHSRGADRDRRSQHRDRRRGRLGRDFAQHLPILGFLGRANA